MNNKIIKVEHDPNHAVAIDDKGISKSISKNSSDYELEDVLKKEDEIENLNNCNNNDKYTLNSKKELYKLSKFITYATLLGIIVMTIPLLKASIPFLQIFLADVAVGSFKFFNLLSCGTLRKQKRRIDAIESRIEKTERVIRRKEEGLDIIKEKIEYKEEVNTNLAVLTVPMQDKNYEDIKVKVKSLR